MPAAISTSTFTTRWRTWGSAWARLSARRWATRRASSATARPSCPWTKPSCTPPWTSRAGPTSCSTCRYAARALVLPGDGAFHDAMNNLQSLGLLEPLKAALDEGRPFLGICLGYQLLFTESEEFGQGKGLDVIPGTVRRFPGGLKVPHMGWNAVEHRGDLRIFDGIPSGAHFYFVHSYYPSAT